MNDTDQLHNQADAALATNRLDDAYIIYTRICQLDTTDVGARMMLGAIEKEKGNLEIAANHLIAATCQDAEFTEAWVMLGTVYGQLGRLQEAEAANRKALALDATLIEARFNLGNALKGLGKSEEAAECYRSVLAIQPGLTSAWPLLASAQLEAGNAAAAIEAAHQAIILNPRDSQSHLVLGQALHNRGQFEDAASSFLRAAELTPDRTDAWFMAGGAFGQAGDYEQAETCSRHAIALAPDHAEAYLNLGSALREQHRIDEAINAFKTASEKRPDSVDALCSLGGAYALLCKYPQAADCYQRAIGKQPVNANLYRSLGNIFRLGGEFTQSEAACRKALELAPDSSDALLELGDALSAQARNDEALDAYNKTIELAPDTIAAIAGQARSYERIREYDKAYECLRPFIKNGANDYNLVTAYALLSKRIGKQRDALRMTEELLNDHGLNDFERACIHFCTGELYEQLGEHDNAFKHIEKGCKYKHAEFDHHEHTTYVKTIIDTFSSSNMAKLPHATNHSERPIFIVGMPRSGTSLVEQIIASHPAVYGAGELSEINYIAASLRMQNADDAHYPRCIKTLTQAQIDSASQSYLAKIAKLAGDDSLVRVSDKMPQNFFHLGIIELLFPGARVIHTMRNPLDSCLSCYFKNFAGFLPYTYDLHNLGHFYHEYNRLMTHWRNTLSLPILNIQYEDLVNEPEKYSRKLIEFCDLEWDDACLRFYESARYVNTASHGQVRKPIYTSSIGRWRTYEQHLKSLRDALDEK